MTTDEVPAKCQHCGQDLRHLERPWNTSNGFYSEWANVFGFPWCPGGTTLVAHDPGLEAT